MSEKRLTAAELKAQQEGREKASKDAQRAAEAEADRRRRGAEDAALVASIEKIKASWYQAVESAAHRDGVRFVVIAEVISGTRITALDDLIRAIQQDGYECTITGVKASQLPGRGIGQLPRNDEECAVENGNLKGWKPPSVPRFGSNGSLQYLIVKWG